MATTDERPRPRRTTHHAHFETPLVVGQTVTGFTFGVTPTGRLSYLTRFSGIYQGLRESEWTKGQMEHFFTGGEIGGTPQRCHGITAPSVV